MKNLKLNLLVLVAAFVLIPIASKAELKSLFINVHNYYYELNDVFEEVSGVYGIEDSYANTANNIITLLYETEETSREVILSRISNLGYNIRLKPGANKMLNDMNIQYEMIEDMTINEVKEILDNHPDVVDYYINTENKMVSIIYKDNTKTKHLISDVTLPSSSKYSIYKNIETQKFLNKN
jgi:hypothetical protein